MREKKEGKSKGVENEGKKMRYVGKINKWTWMEKGGEWGGR